jgi:hypothetical protein
MVALTTYILRLILSGLHLLGWNAIVDVLTMESSLLEN